jgi:predicted CXXCH cytochrome family protein
MKFILKKYFGCITIFLFLFFFITSQLFSQDFDCSDCHEVELSKSAHSENLECIDCHSDVIDEEHADEGAKKVQCGDCHNDYLEAYKSDIHHRLKQRVGKDAPTCQTCHDSHEMISPSSIKNKVDYYCSDCHTNIELNFAFHTMNFTPDETCQECHEAEEYRAELKPSVHSELACSDCHIYEVKNFDLHQEGVPNLEIANCYTCHADQTKEHKESIHGISLLQGIDEAAKCWDCHGSHSIKIVSDPESPVSPKNLPATCGQCHNDTGVIEKIEVSALNPPKMYSTSVHGKVVEAGGEAANCSSCHGIHDIKDRIQPGSKISSFNVPNTCGECHAKETEEYLESIHWALAKKGVRSSPVCNDCHSEHGIDAINTAGQSRKEMQKIQEETCYVCHQNPKISSRYSDDGESSQAKEYQDSYHGLAVMRGYDKAAMCIDCHETHRILPAKHEESSINKANVKTTCAKCHAGATETFAQSYSHTSSVESAYVEDVVENIYVWLILVVIGGMVIHNAIIFSHEIRSRRKKSKYAVTIPRFTKNEVIQHIILFTSFILLAITGFALKFPESWWSEGLAYLGMTEWGRAVSHRVSAVVMTVLSLYHAAYLLFTVRGREVLFNMLPKLEDIKQLSESLMYYLHLSKTKPEYDKYDYTEKAEYWALIWGTMVMAVTGLILWFPTLVGDWAPSWLIKVSETIHFYEAILASLAILVWHWFFVIFHPREYPMSFTWVDGKMSLEAYRHHHDKHFKRVMKEWVEYKSGNLEEKNLSNSTTLFAEALKKNNLDPMNIIKEELSKDEKLRSWFEENVNGTV